MDDQPPSLLGSAQPPPRPQRRWRDRVFKAWADLSLSRVQSVVAITAGLLSIIGALYSFTLFVSPAHADGELLAVVQDATSQEGVSDAVVEVLTAKNALVSTLEPDAIGRVRQRLTEGTYPVRVSHPKFAAESRKIEVLPGRTVEFTLSLRAGSSVPLQKAKDAIGGGVRAVGRAFGF